MKFFYQYMSLKEQASQILNDFENTQSDKIVQTLDEIKNQLKSQLTKDYLQGKIDALNNAKTEPEKKALCKNLIPYLDWYVQGI